MRDNNVDPPMITLQRLRVLKTVASEGRFSKAADILGITQPAVSLQIRQLESYCEGAIFERTGSGLILTELGSIVLRYADQILGLSDELEDATRQFTKVEKGSIKIGASSTPGDYIVPGLIGKFNDLYPKIDVSLHISNSETVMTMLNSREIDIGVGGVETADPALCSFPFEKDEIVINVGLRYDEFDANTTYPSQRRNPVNASTYYLKDSDGLDSLDSDGNLILNESRMSSPVQSKIASQISPRFGFAYQLGNVAVLHFSYGHFLQMPPMYAIYSNHSSIIGPSDYSTTVGNANLASDSLGLNAQKTVSYEVGLWQELGKNTSLEINLYYRDIYDLLSLATVSTFNQVEYGIYTNKDYGNVRGLELKLDYSLNNLFIQTNYTYQFTRGNADNPAQTFNRQGASIDEVIRFIPMSWDQRHTFNLSLGYNTALYGITATGYYNSGTPYTFSPQGESNLALLNLYPNNDYKPSNYYADLSGYINLPKFFGVSSRLDFLIYNLTDRYNEYGVSSETGRAYTAVVNETELLSHRSNFNTYEDRYKDPSMFSAPRQIKLGLTVLF